MARWSGNPDFDLFKLADEHDELRGDLRASARRRSRRTRRTSTSNARFPEEALTALNAAGFNAIHVPEEYGGQGADSVAACIVIEEVARVVRSSSLIPA